MDVLFFFIHGAGQGLLLLLRHSRGYRPERFFLLIFSSSPLARSAEQFESRRLRDSFVCEAG